MLAPVPEGTEAQHRLASIQLFRWGTFHKHTTIPVARSGFLLTGESGSGKSTVLDAHAMLLTPPKHVRLNVAAEGEGGGRDRNPMTYVRGAWGQEDGAAGITTKFLRDNTTWSAIAESYETLDGRAMTIAQVFWIKGVSRQTSDVQRLYLVIERPLSLTEFIPFADAEFDRAALKTLLPDAHISTEFSPYGAKFRRILGIENDTALRLLHKTQSAKNLGDLNPFLRDFMLDAPRTFETAKRAVEEFTALKAAHGALVTTRRQRDHLRRAVGPTDEHALQRRARDEAATYEGALDGYAATRRVELLGRQEARLAAARDDASEAAQASGRAYAAASDLLDVLKDRQRDLGDGGLERLQGLLAAARTSEAAALRHYLQLQTACATLQLDLPSSPAQFRDAVSELEAYRAARSDRAELGRVELHEAIQRRDAILEAARVARRELLSLQRQPSNVTADLLSVRDTMAEALAIPITRLPFLGQLLEVLPAERHWQGAIERALAGDTQALVVGTRDLATVLRYLRDTFLSGKRVTVLEAVEVRQVGTYLPRSETIGAKLQFAEGPFTTWLRQRAANAYTHLCTNDMVRYQAADKAVTESGLLKVGRERHTKDDRFSVTDAKRWNIGFSNAPKIALYQAQVATLDGELRMADAAVVALERDRDRAMERDAAAAVVLSKQWSDVDVLTHRSTAESYDAQIAALQVARPEIAQLERDVVAQRAVVAAAQSLANKDQRTVDDLIDRYLACVQALEAARAGPPPELSDEVRAALDALFAEYPTISLETLQTDAANVSKRLSTRKHTASAAMGRLEVQIAGIFESFAKEWPAAASDHPTTFESAPAFLAMLARIEAEDLPRFEQEFLTMLRAHTTKQLIQLVNELDSQRQEIPLRMDEVNTSLEKVEFNRGTTLRIRTDARPLREVQDFRAQLKQCTEGLASDDATVAIERFRTLEQLITRLGSDERANVQWRETVLDVRQHVEFIASERDAQGTEVDVYRSGVARSGGQRQILTATVLAAALRYNLGGADSALPTFATVVLDEAFDKADSNFTQRAMNIFRRLGFQMVIATPNKSVQTLSAFVGGVGVIKIKERQFSYADKILIDRTEPTAKSAERQTDTDRESEDDDEADLGDSFATETVLA